MKIIIDISEEDYNFIKDLQFYSSGRRSGRTIEKNIIDGIKNGTPLKESNCKEHTWFDDCHPCTNCQEFECDGCEYDLMHKGERN